MAERLASGATTHPGHIHCGCRNFAGTLCQSPNALFVGS
jgi:hypothetical protein